MGSGGDVSGWVMVGGLGRLARQSLYARARIAAFDRVGE
jgi:hypothetical protein